MMNLEAIGGQDLIIASFDINVSDDAPPAEIRLYIREGGYQGYEHSADSWTLASTAVVTAMGKDAVTHLPIGGIRLTAGKIYGIYMCSAEETLRFRYTYTEPTPLYQDDHLRLSGGTGQSIPLFGGALHSPRIWNGTVYYTIAPDEPQTGDSASRLLWVWALIAAAAAAAAVLLYRAKCRG